MAKMSEFIKCCMCPDRATVEVMIDGDFTVVLPSDGVMSEEDRLEYSAADPQAFCDTCNNLMSLGRYDALGARSAEGFIGMYPEYAEMAGILAAKGSAVIREFVLHIVGDAIPLIDFDELGV